MAETSSDEEFFKELKRIFCEDSKDMYCDWEQQIMRMLFYRFESDMKNMCRKQFFIPKEFLNENGTVQKEKYEQHERETTQKRKRNDSNTSRKKKKHDEKE
jgi:hypothetical protein